MTNVIETPEFIYVFVNNFPYYDAEIVNEEKGIIRIYGRDGDKKKINYVKYPAKHYTKKYVEEYILQQYDDCKLCNIGTEIITTPKIEAIKSFGSSIKIKNKGLGTGIIIGLLSAFPIVLFLIRKKLSNPES